MKRCLLLIALIAVTAPVSAQDASDEEQAAPDWSEENALIEQMRNEKSKVFAAPRIAQNYVQRGLTLPRLVLRGDLGLHVTGGAALPTNLVLSVGASFGVIDNLEVGISQWRMGTMRNPLLAPGSGPSGLISLRFTNGIVFGDMPIWARYRFLRGSVEMAAELGVQIPTHTDFGFWLGVPIRIHASRSISIDTGLHFAVQFPSGTSAFSLRVPVQLNFGIGSSLYVGLSTGLGVVDFDRIYIPLGAQLGYTLGLGNKNPLLDLELSFSFPSFVQTGLGETIQTTFFVGLNGRFYYGL